jgi:hypothetical protein
MVEGYGDLDIAEGCGEAFALAVERRAAGSCAVARWQAGWVATVAARTPAPSS